MGRRPEPFWVSILSREFYGNEPTSLSARKLVIEARRAIGDEIKALKATLDPALSSEQKLKILDTRRETLAHKCVRTYKERIQSTTGMNEMQAPPARLSHEEVLSKIKAFIHTRISTQQGPRRHNDVSFCDATISLLAEFYLNANPNPDLEQIYLQKRSVIDFLTFIELASSGQAVTIQQIMTITGYQTPTETIRIMSELLKEKHSNFKLGSYKISGNSVKGWTLEKTE